MNVSSTGSASDSEVRVEEVRAQLDRICTGEPFRRSRRLREFLRYICELTLDGKGEEINECLIGIEVFGRGANYNPSEDSVVRRQAHSLRQKLEEYYASDGAEDPILIEVPLGHYVPAFRRRDPKEHRGDETTATPPPPPPAEPSRPEQSRTWSPVWVAGAALAAVLAFAAGRSSVATPGSAAGRHQALDAPLTELWGAWFASSAEPLIVFSSPHTGIVKHFPEPVPADSLPRRIRLSDDLEADFRAGLGLPGGGALYISPSVTEAKSGEALGAIQLAALFARGGLRPRGTLSRLVTWEDFRTHNLILLGHGEQNHLVVPVLEKYPLRLDNTDGPQPRRIVNVDPRDGEPADFQICYAEDENHATIEYALVSMLPGLDGQQELLVVSGLNTQATLMAIEFLTDPRRVEPLLDRFRESDPDRRTPWRFQLVLRAEVHDKVPTGGAVELVRLLD